MGIFDFFKKKRDAESTMPKNQRGMDEATFNSKQFRTEILAFALWKYNEHNENYDKVKVELRGLQNMNEQQIESVVDALQRWNNLKNVQEVKAGQIWKYKTRANEELSRVTVFKVDSVGDMDIVHISIDNLAIKNPKVDTGLSEKIGHTPLSKEAFLSSVIELVSENTNQEIEEGYYHWKQEFDNGKAGFFEVEISEVVAFIEQSMNN